MHCRLCKGLLTLAIILILVYSVNGQAFANTGNKAADYKVKVGLVTDAESLGFRANTNYQLVNQLTGAVIADVKTSERWEINRTDSNLVVSRNGSQVGVFNVPIAVKQFVGKPVTILSDERTSTGTGSDLSVISGSGNVTRIGANLNNYHIVSSQGTSQIAQGASETGLLTLETTKGSKRYRGELEFKINSSGKLLAINVVPIEEYLYGVVPSEMPASFGLEALKAQTLAARTYALRATLAQANKDYQLVATDASQVYGGYDAESSLVNRAIQETTGEVITYEGKLIDAVFFSSSGGYTDNSEEIWKNFFPYLRWKQDPYDMNQNHYNWVVNYTADQLTYQINQGLPRIGFTQVFGRVNELEEVARTSSGARVSVMKIHGYCPQGNDITLQITSADSVRIALGLKSALFTFSQQKDEWGKFSSVTINGSGWGHGIGLSQYGARGMAAQGYNYREILEYYYTGIKILPGYGL